MLLALGNQGTETRSASEGPKDTDGTPHRRKTVAQALPAYSDSPRARHTTTSWGWLSKVNAPMKRTLLLLALLLALLAGLAVWNRSKAPAADASLIAHYTFDEGKGGVPLCPLPLTSCKTSPPASSKDQCATRPSLREMAGPASSRVFLSQPQPAKTTSPRAEAKTAQDPVVKWRHVLLMAVIWLCSGSWRLMPFTDCPQTPAPAGFRQSSP